MNFASKVAYIGNDEDEDLAVEEDDLASESLVANLDKPKKASAPSAPSSGASGFFSSLFRRSSAVPAQPAGAPPAAPPPPASAQKEEQKKSRRVHHEADTNVVTLNFATLASNADELFAGDPVECKKCKVILSSTSTIVSRADLAKAKKAPAADNQPQSAVPGAAVKIVSHDQPLAAPPAAMVPSPADDSKADDEPAGSMWVCEFCGNENPVDLDPEEIPKTESRDYVLDPGAGADEKQQQNQKDHGAVVFVIDISGSMCSTTEVPGHKVFKGAKKPAAFDLPAEAGFVNAPVRQSNSTWVSRLQCMQAAVNQQIEAWQKDQPDRLVGVVTFNREVTIYGDGTMHPEVVTGDKLNKHDELVACGNKFSLQKPISQTAKTLSDRLLALEEGGPTALGPALLVAVSMASRINGSRVVVCTDGLANVGVGALDKSSCPTDAAKEAAEAWYESVGQLAKTAGVGVSIISIKGEECALEALGKVAEITGGDITRVDPLELDKNFSSMLAKPIIATKVVASFHIHSGLHFRNEEVDSNKVVREIGNATEDTEVAFEYGVRSADQLARYENLKTLPFQVQIHFTKLDGMRCLRVLSKSQAVSRSRAEAEQDLRLEVLAANAAQQSAKMAEKGDYRRARVHNLAFGKLMKRNAARDADSSSVYSNWVQESDGYHGALSRQEAKLDMMEAAASPAPKVASVGPAPLGAAAPAASAASHLSPDPTPSRARISKSVRSDQDFAQLHSFKSKGASKFK